jgi:tRNA nucleotidyltransferase (CCA-adding enzyme)
MVDVDPGAGGGDGEAVLARLPGLPGGVELLAVAAEHAEPIELVGGAVRDLMLGAAPRELDAVVQGDPDEVAQALAAQLGGARVTTHGRFGTALVESPGVRIDLAAARAESYPEPGGLPEVRPGSPEQDLLRRDFTVNAIAVGLAGEHAGRVRAVRHALDDLASGRLRVLHDASFSDDPTRLLRLARYASRLDFDPEEHTRLLAARAVDAGAITRVSGARVGAELRLALTERDPLGALAELQRLRVLAALHPRLRFDEPLAREALRLLPPDARADLLLLAAVALPLSLTAAPDERGELRLWLDRLEFPAADRDRSAAIVAEAPRLVDALSAAEAPSALRAAVGRAPVEAVALAGALGATAAAQRWLHELRAVRLEITGEDLMAAGIPPGPEIGRRLAAALDRRLDGDLAPGREAELAAALQV